MGIKQVLSAPRSPWQRAYVEQLIGTIRRKCLDYTIVFNKRCLYRYPRALVSITITAAHIWLSRKTVRCPDQSRCQTPDG